MIGRVRPPVRLQFRLVTVFEPTDRRREFNFKVRVVQNVRATLWRPVVESVPD